MLAKSYLLNMNSAGHAIVIRNWGNTSKLSPKWICFSRKTTTVRNNRNGRAPNKSMYSFHAIMENLEVKILCVGMLKFLHMLMKQLNVYRECLQETEAIQVKLKSKDAIKHHALHEPVRPNKCIDALQWLIEKSELLGIKV